MVITYGDHLIDSGYYDITPEQERGIEEARDKELRDRAYDCPCGGWDCSGLPGGPLPGCPDDQPQLVPTREQIMDVCRKHASCNMTFEACEAQAERITDAITALLSR